MFKWLYNKIAPAQIEHVYSDKSSQEAARAAVDRATKDYNTVVANSDRVDELVTKLRYQKERNHFGYLIEQTMRGGDKR